MNFLLDVKFMIFTYWEWLLVASSIALMLQFRLVHNLVLLSLWPARYPLLAVIYVSIFILYLFAKALDPRAADLILMYMTKGLNESFPLVRFLKGIYISSAYRRMSMYDFPTMRERRELNQVVDAVNNGSGLGSLESRLRKYYGERKRIDSFIEKCVESVRLRK